MSIGTVRLPTLIGPWQLAGLLPELGAEGEKRPWISRAEPRCA